MISNADWYKFVHAGFLLGVHVASEYKKKTGALLSAL